MHPFLRNVYVLGRDNNDSHPATLNKMKLPIGVVENRKEKKLCAPFGVLLREGGRDYTRLSASYCAKELVRKFTYLQNSDRTVADRL